MVQILTDNCQELTFVPLHPAPQNSQSRPQSLRYVCPADGATDVLEESKTETTKIILVPV